MFRRTDEPNFDAEQDLNFVHPTDIIACRRQDFFDIQTPGTPISMYFRHNMMLITQNFPCGSAFLIKNK